MRAAVGAAVDVFDLIDVPPQIRVREETVNLGVICWYAPSLLITMQSSHLP